MKERALSGDFLDHPWAAMRDGAIGSALSSLGAVATGQCYELDLGGTVTGNGTFSYVVKGDVNDAVWYASSESTANNKPQLIVTTN